MTNSALARINSAADKGSALFVVPPGASPGGFVGETLID